MSAWAEKMEARLAELDRRVLELATSQPTVYTGPARLADETLRTSVLRVASETIRLPLGTLGASQPVIARANLAWSASYATGGQAVGGVTGMVPGFTTVEASPMAGYTFQYVSGTAKLKAFTAAGVEVVATTNLEAAIGTTPMNIIGAQPGTFPLYTAKGDELVTRVEMQVEDEILQSLTNYWTIVCRARAVGQDYGADIGNTVDTSLNGFGARSTQVLYSNPVGTRLDAGTVLLALATGTGSVRGSLTNASLIVTLNRQVT